MAWGPMHLATATTCWYHHISRVFEQLYNEQLLLTANFELDCLQTKKQDYEANKRLRNMIVKNKDLLYSLNN